MSPPPHRVETPVQSPGSGGYRPAPGPQGLPGGDNAGRPPSVGRTPDYRDALAPGREPAPPVPAARPALDSPGTTVHWPPQPDIAPRAPRPGGALGSAPQSDR